MQLSAMSITWLAVWLAVLKDWIEGTEALKTGTRGINTRSTQSKSAVQVACWP